MPTLYLMVGLPGAGKTTAAQTICKVTGAVHMWADEHRKSKFPNPKFDSAENQSLYQQLNSEVSVLLGQQKSVVFDTAFNHYSDRQRLREIAKKHRADSIIIWVQAPDHLARARATTNSHQQTTRILGNMSQEHFDSLSSKLEPPNKEEKTITVDGTKVTEAYIKDLLKS